MPVFIIIIVLSISLYIFYKVKEFRVKAPYEKRWTKSKSNIALGIFIGVFGLNRLFINESTYDLVIGSVFLILGLINVYMGYKAYKYFLPLAVEENQRSES
ncbi:YtpI family protein [Pseudalkalibacillus salsuginis]|uniref:YtpI family protein n=1 Tax=Pseudalkalibacillus salsuginis TaxID=2910972 RepID=UPI001F160D32|nr:YtpI family protein [Pseudalkalibacillus salsuginis]MCF6408761.1 YtpI family protein [Pseudalkalibacillus salsuginis]